MSKNILVLGGCGDMGQFAVRDLIAHTDAHVTIADYREKDAQALAAGFGERADGVFVDATDPEGLRKVIEGHDACVGLIGPFFRFAPAMVRASMAAGVPYVDVCDDPAPLAHRDEFHQLALDAGVPAITGLGMSPGLTNLMVRAGVEELDEAHKAGVYWVGGAQDSDGRAVIEHIIDILTGEVSTVEEGQVATVRALTAPETIRFPAPYGDVTVCHGGHPEPLTLKHTFPQLQTAHLKGALSPAWNMRLARMLDVVGATKTEARRRRLAGLIHASERLLGSGGHPVSSTRVDVHGTKDGKPAIVTYTSTDKMGNLTGIPAAIGGAMLADGLVTTPGFHAPEDILDPHDFFARVAQRGVIVDKGVPN